MKEEARNSAELHKVKGHDKLVWTLILTGIAFAAAGFYVPPLGEISGSVLGMTGECFTLAGGMLGIGVYAQRIARKEGNNIRRELGMKEDEDI